MTRFVTAVLSALAIVAGSVSPVEAATAKTTFTVDIWADNWFSFYVNGVKVVEDPEPITQTKSFNKVTAQFSATYPLTIAAIAKDYVENKSGLEYIGTANQQIGDGGFIAQLHETKSGAYVTSTSSDWKTYVTFSAPLDPACSKSASPLVECKWRYLTTPSSWLRPTFNSAKWASAVKYSTAQVSPKEGYFDVAWDPRARLIWSKSLTLDNTVLFRKTVRAAPVKSNSVFSITSPSLKSNVLGIENTCDGKGEMPSLSWTGVPEGTNSLLLTFDTPAGPARPGESIQTDFNHLVQFNIPSSSTGITPTLALGQVGKNFKGQSGYAPPCSQGPGLKSYTFHLIALSKILDGSYLTGIQAKLAAQDFIIAETQLTLTYSR